MITSIKPWTLVITGIIFNICSAVIAHYFIGMNNQQLNRLEQKISQYDTFIESQWRTKTSMDRKQEFLLLLLTQSAEPVSPAIRQYVVKQLNDTKARQEISDQQFEINSRLDFDTINSFIELVKQKIIDSINDSYLQRIDIENQQIPLQKKNTLLLTISIFLQVLGLILVLAKDVNRH